MLIPALLLLLAFEHVQATTCLSSTSSSTSVLWSNSSSLSITRYTLGPTGSQTPSIPSSNLSQDLASLSATEPSQTDDTAPSSTGSSTFLSNGTVTPLASSTTSASSSYSSMITLSSSTANTLQSVLPGGFTTINDPTTSSTAWLALITSTVTTVPPNLETSISTNTEWTANTWLTTSRPSDLSSTIVPVLVGCPGCGGVNGGIIIFNLPATPHVSFQLPKLPGLPTFHLPCVKVFGVTVAGDCNDPPQTNDDSEPKSTATEEPTQTEASQSQSQSTTESSTSSSSSSSASSCFLNPFTSILGAQWSLNDAASSSMSSEYYAPAYASMYSRYSLQGWFLPPPMTTSTTSSFSASSSAPTSTTSRAQPGSTLSTSLSPTSNSGSNAATSSTVASLTAPSQPTTLQTSTVPASTMSESSSSPLTGSPSALPKLTTTQCRDSTLVNCQWIFNPATACPTTTELLPASCTETTTPTLLTTSAPVPTTATTAPTSTMYVFIAFQQYAYEGETGGNQWNLYAEKPKQTLYWCDDSIDSVGDDKIKAMDTVDVKNLPWPSGKFKFPSKHGVDDCVYTGTQASIGQIACPGKDSTTCIADPLVGTTKLCDPDSDGGFATVYPKVVCRIT